MRNRGSRCLVCALIVLITDSLAKAQTGSGTIQGTVTDPTGAVVPGASVTATNIATGVQTPRSTTAARLVCPLTAPTGSVQPSGDGIRLSASRARRHHSGRARDHRFGCDAEGREPLRSK